MTDRGSNEGCLGSAPAEGDHFYWVVSPDIYHDGGGYEAPEEGPCVVGIWAPSKREAIRRAVQHGDMREWVHEARSAGKPPFSGLVARIQHCPHGVCLCHDNFDDGLRESCPVCRDFDLTVDRLRTEALADDWQRDKQIVDWANSYDVSKWDPENPDLPPSKASTVGGDA